jgi:hypothetical protein
LVTPPLQPGVALTLGGVHRSLTDQRATSAGVTLLDHTAGVDLEYPGIRLGEPTPGNAPFKHTL